MTPELETLMTRLAFQQGQFVDSMMLWFMIHGIVERAQDVGMRIIPHPLDDPDKIVMHIELWAHERPYGTFKARWTTLEGKPGISCDYVVPPTFALISQAES